MKTNLLICEDCGKRCQEILLVNLDLICQECYDNLVRAEAVKEDTVVQKFDF